jgi:ABC-type nickel/cobalt efflux system permease component RcnA
VSVAALVSWNDIVKVDRRRPMLLEVQHASMSVSDRPLPSQVASSFTGVDHGHGIVPAHERGHAHGRDHGHGHRHGHRHATAAPTATAFRTGLIACS